MSPLMSNKTRVSQYTRIKEELVRRMESGELKVGDKLPSEPELARHFQVSRETVRAAIKQLEQEGKLEVRIGIGRFVRRPLATIPSSMTQFMSTGEVIRSAGLKEGQLEQSIRTELCQPEWAERLMIEPGTPVLVNERIRTANQEPVAYNINIMPLVLVQEAFNRTPLSGSLLQFLEDECGIRLSGTTTEIVVPLHTDPAYLKLRVKPDTTVLLMKQTHFDQHQLPVLFSYDYYRNDIFQFWVNRERN